MPQSSHSDMARPASGGTGTLSSDFGTGPGFDPSDGSRKNSGIHGTRSGSRPTSTANSGDGDGNHHSDSMAVAAILSAPRVAAVVVFIFIIVLRRVRAQQ